METTLIVAYKNTSFVHKAERKKKKTATNQSIKTITPLSKSGSLVVKSTFIGYIFKAEGMNDANKSTFIYPHCSI